MQSGMRPLFVSCMSVKGTIWKIIAIPGIFLHFEGVLFVLIMVKGSGISLE